MKIMSAQRLRRGFTLVELTVVILIIGVLVTVAAPRFFDSVTTAKNKSAAQTVEVLRDAIQLYQANNGNYPGQDGTEATLKADLASFLRKEFPACQVGKANANVAFSDANPLVSTADPAAWIYNKTTGEIRINTAAFSTY